MVRFPNMGAGNLGRIRVFVDIIRARCVLWRVPIQAGLSAKIELPGSSE
jgi:hypothetical protein